MLRKVQYDKKKSRQDKKSVWHNKTSQYDKIRWLGMRKLEICALFSKGCFVLMACHAVFAKQLVMISAKSTLFKKVKFKRIKNSAQFYRQTFAFDFIPIFAHLLLFLMVLR